MTRSVLCDALGEIDTRFVEEALDKPVALRIAPRYFAAAAACVILVVGVLWRWLPVNPSRLSDPSVTITHKPIEAHPQYPFPKILNTTDISASLTMSEIEKLEKPISYFLEHTDNDLFSCIVTRIDTLELDFNGVRRYVLLAYVQIRTVFRSEFQSGDEVRILLTDTLCQETDSCPLFSFFFEVGRSVLLSAERLDTSQIRRINDASLVLCDVAEYSHSDRDYILIGDDDK